MMFEAEHNGIMSVTVMEPFTGSNKAMVSSNISGKPGGLGGANRQNQQEVIGPTPKVTPRRLWQRSR